MGECKTCKLQNEQLTNGVCDGCIGQMFDQTGKKPLKATKGKDGNPAFGKAFRTGWSVVKGDVCSSCAGWGDHEDCDCEYEPSEVHRGGQCVWCDSGDECEAEESGLKCPYDKEGN